MRRRRGFTSVELIVAVVLAAVVATAALRLLIANHRLHRRQIARLRVQATLRTAFGIITSELRELDPDDPAGSDILGMSRSSLAYRAARSLAFVCRGAAPGSPEVVLWGRRRYGLRDLDPARDSLLIYASGGWVRADLLAVAAGTCPGNVPGITIRVAARPAGALADLPAGTPVRGFELVELRLYAARTGSRWIGYRGIPKSGARSVIQPLTGPVAVDGLQLVYFDPAGAIAGTPADVARIGLAITGRSGGPDPVQAALTAQVALRNR